MRKSLQILNIFNTLALKQILWKTKSFFKKLEQLFLVEATKIENTSFPYKAAVSEVNVKTNRMRSTEWTYHKERSFYSNYFMFLKTLFQFQNLLQRADLIQQLPKCLYTYCSLALEFYLKILFPLSILKEYKMDLKIYGKQESEYY